MAVEDHRQDVAGHGVDRVHGGGEGRDQDLAAVARVVARDHVRGVVWCGEDGVQRPGIAGKGIAVLLVEVPQRSAERVRRQCAQRLVARNQRRVGPVAGIGQDPCGGIGAGAPLFAHHALGVAQGHVGDRPVHVPGRGFDHLGEIGFLDVQRPGIGQHAAELAVIEHAIDHHHDGEILHRLGGEVAVLQDRDQVGRLNRGQGAEIGKIGPAQQVAPCRQDAGGIGVADRMAAGQRHLAHRAQDGVALLSADGTHLGAAVLTRRF